MKKIMIIALLLASTALFAKPAIKFKSTTFDFGQVASGKTIDIVFEFENSGDEVLIIKNIIPACGCTTAALAKKEYKPGEKGTIAGKFNTSGYNGKVIKTITVNSNDPDMAETRLAVSGTVFVKDFAQADMKPGHIPFGAVASGKAYVRKLNLSNLGNLDLRILEVSSSPEVSLAFKTNAVGARQSTEIILTFTPFEKGTFNNMVKIRTNDYRSPYIFVRLEAEID
ncbi:MAG: DUF1573 domain-containing protein [Acidobacteria bacterium]|jgi:hypothetical protein|nr:DUF1573 domain-containing protein [Acidobacteriota bacterium]